MNFNFSTHQDIKTAYKESPQKFSDKEIAEFPQNKVPPSKKISWNFFSLPPYLKTNKRKEKVKKRKRKDVFIYLFKFLL